MEFSPKVNKLSFGQDNERQSTRQRSYPSHALLTIYTLNLFQDTPSSLQTLLHEATAHPLEPQWRPPDQEVLIPFQATKPAL